jgi:hypothetical protein
MMFLVYNIEYYQAAAYLGTIDTLVEDSMSTPSSSRTYSNLSCIDFLLKSLLLIENLWLLNTIMSRMRNRNRKQQQRILIRHITFCPTKPKYSYPIPSGDGSLNIADYICKP